MVVLKITGSTLAETLWALLLIVVIFSTSSILLERYYRIGITVDELRIRNLAISEWYFQTHQQRNQMTATDTLNQYIIKHTRGSQKILIEILDNRKNQTYTYEFPNH